MLTVLIILGVVLLLVFIILIIGFISACRDRNKTKLLQQSSDYDFKTKNGRFGFTYIIKGFPTEEGKELKVVLQAGIGFSDIISSTANAKETGCCNIEIRATDNRSGEVYVMEEEPPRDKNGLRPMSLTEAILLPPEALDGQGAADAHIVIRTKWSLGGRQVDEVLEFDYKK